MPVQNAAKKKGIHLELAPHALTSFCSMSYPHARRRVWQEKDAEGLSVALLLMNADDIQYAVCISYTGLF